MKHSHFRLHALLTGPASDIKQSPKKIRPTHGESLRKPLPVYNRHGGFCLESTAVASSNQNTANKHVQVLRIHC